MGVPSKEDSSTKAGGEKKNEEAYNSSRQFQITKESKKGGVENAGERRISQASGQRKKGL